MNTIITFLMRSSNDQGKGRKLFSLVLHEDCVQRNIRFVSICAPYVLYMEYTCNYLRLTLRAVAQAFCYDLTRSSFCSYSSVVLVSRSRYDDPIRRGDNSKLLTTLSLLGTHKTDENDHSALKRLVKRIELLAPISVLRNRDPEAKYRLLLQAVLESHGIFIRSQSSTTPTTSLR